MREQNGEKVFWGRGNGWVTGALTFIIDNMPAQHPSRIFYISLFRQMMKRYLRFRINKASGTLLYWTQLPIPCRKPVHQVSSHIACFGALIMDILKKKNICPLQKSVECISFRRTRRRQDRLCTTNRS